MTLTFPTRADHVDTYLASHMNAVQSAVTMLTGVIVSVKESTFGAIGNGAVDDAAPIQAAIDAVYSAGGGTVFLPTGTYRIETSLVMKTGVALVGMGWGSILKAKNALNANVIKSAATNDATMIDMIVCRDFAIDGNKANQTNGNPGSDGGVDKFGLNLNGVKNSLIDHIYVHDSIHTGIYIGGPQNTVQNCRVENIGTGSQVLGTSGIVFNYIASPHHGSRCLHNRVTGVHEHGIKVYPDAEDVLIDGNFVGTAGDFGIWLQGVHESVVVNNTVDGATEVGIYLGVDASTGLICCNNIVQNTIVDPTDGGGHGIQIYNVVGGVCSGNFVKNNGAVGIRLLNSTYFQVGPDTMIGNASLALYETGTSDHNQFIKPVTQGNGTDAFTVAGANSSLVGASVQHITFNAPDMFTYNLTGTGNDVLGLQYFDSSGVVMLDKTNLYKAPVNLHIVGLVVELNAARITGTADFYIKIAGASGVSLAGTLCRIDGSNTLYKAVFAANHAAGLAVTAGQTIQIQTDNASFTPITADAKAYLVLSVD